MFNKLFSPLISENDTKKEQENVKLDAEADKNIATTNLCLTKITNYPNLNIFHFIRYLIFSIDAALVIYFFFNTFNTTHENDFTVTDYSILCNSTNTITTFDELKNMKAELDKIDYAKNSVKFVSAEYNISKYANEYLAEKYANLTNSYDTLKQPFNTQKELYFECYKENLIKHCSCYLSISGHVYFFLIKPLFLLVLLFVEKIFRQSIQKNLDIVIEEKEVVLNQWEAYIHNRLLLDTTDKQKCDNFKKCSCNLLQQCENGIMLLETVHKRLISSMCVLSWSTVLVVLMQVVLSSCDISDDQITKFTL